MKRSTFLVYLALCLPAAGATNWTLLGWNNLGMHCMDSDYGVFSILPPYNVIHAQLIRTVNGQAELITNAAGLEVTYEAIADPDGSMTRTARGKTDFWSYVQQLFGLALQPDEGLPVPGPIYRMPGTNNTPQAMAFEPATAWFAAYGVPITPYDDADRKNPYPMMRIRARLDGNTVATTDIVLPVSDEMDCRACHASGSSSAAMPAAGWVWEALPSRDYRLNILRLHDSLQLTNSSYADALATHGFHADGLFATVVEDGRPILCAACHLSEALPGSGLPGISPLTRAMHSGHADVQDPGTGHTLDADAERGACYLCHPGSETRCLRGAMGSAVAADGSASMQCQSCHGSMATVGSATRTGWLEEPNCQACHTGDALSNNGQIRYTSVFLYSNVMRVAVNTRFATTPDAPAPGLSLYRFSFGHGGLACSACHGSTHAEFPATHRNDNIASIQHQGYAGTVIQCTSCHTVYPLTIHDGPHGMHPVGPNWASGHGDLIEAVGPSQCRACHGLNYRGTELSRMKADRVVSTRFGVRHFWKGFQVSCYACHSTPSNADSATTNLPAVVASVATSTAVNVAVPVYLAASDANGNALTLRVVTQPDNGSAGITGLVATYFPERAYEGTSTFTVAAWDGWTDSNLATVQVVVAGGPCVYVVDPTSQGFNELGGAAVARVLVPGTCTWSAASEARWIAIHGVDGSGTGAVHYSVERNSDALARTGTISVAGRVLTVTQAGAPPDTVGDGVPDIWKVAYFGSTSSTNAGADADPDRDGLRNCDEYLAGTVPTDPDSAPEVDLVAVTPAGALLGVTTATGRLYKLERSQDIRANYWPGFTGAVTGTGGVENVSDADGGSRWFYRMRLTR
jgi:hypothetical protein